MLHATWKFSTFTFLQEKEEQQVQQFPLFFPILYDKKEEKLKAALEMPLSFSWRCERTHAEGKK